MAQIVYTPGEESHYTGMLSGIYYVDGKQVSEAEFREDAVKLALKRAKEVKSVNKMSTIKRLGVNILAIIAGIIGGKALGAVLLWFDWRSKGER